MWGGGWVGGCGLNEHDDKNQLSKMCAVVIYGECNMTFVCEIRK